MKRPQGAGEELLVIERAYQLIQVLTKQVDGFPRQRRFVLGDRLLNNAYGVLDLLIEAKYTRHRGPILSRANIALEKLRFQLRLAHDDRLISTRAYARVAESVDEIGRLAGGWRRRGKSS